MLRSDLSMPLFLPLRRRSRIGLECSSHGSGLLCSSFGRRRACRSFALALVGPVLVLAGRPVLAQRPSPNQPLAIKGLPPEPCPLLVPGRDRSLQPLRIQPSQVALKNALGCLSPADAAVYGPDGCPVKLCKAPQGTMPLPQL